jgi:hypothetical protein
VAASAAHKQAISPCINTSDEPWEFADTVDHFLRQVDAIERLRRGRRGFPWTIGNGSLDRRRLSLCPTETDRSVGTVIRFQRIPVLSSVTSIAVKNRDL